MLAREPVGLLYNPTLLQVFAHLPQARHAQPRRAPAHRRRAGRGATPMPLPNGPPSTWWISNAASRWPAWTWPHPSRCRPEPHRPQPGDTQMNASTSNPWPRCGTPAALSALAAAAALCAPRPGAGDLQGRHRQLPVGPGGRELRHPGGQRRQGADRRLQQGRRAGAVQQGRLRRHEDRVRLCRRERRRHQAGAGTAQPVRPREGRRGGRLRRLGRLPGRGAGGRGDEEVPDPLRLRHAAHLRGRQVQLRVPHRVARDDGQRGAGALPEGPERQGRVPST